MTETDWAQDKKRIAELEAALDRAQVDGAAMRGALETLWKEVQWSGNDKATNDGWPSAIKLTRQALTEHPGDKLLAEAEQRGMLRAAEIARGFPAMEHGHLCVTPVLMAVHVAGEIAASIEQAIERAAKED